MAPSRMSTIIGRIWVTFTTLLIAFIAYSVQIFVLYPWYGSEMSVDLITLLGPFNILIGLLYLNYFKTVMTDPGGVSKSWIPQGDNYEVKKFTGSPRYCRTCDCYKPPRTHHCRQCKRCVLRMDHHCPWVNNCVGNYNYAHFIRFLVYVDISCIYHIWMLTSRVFALYNPRSNYWVEPSSNELIFIILNYVACVPVILCVGGFSGYHVYCLCTNTTTIESWEKNKAATLIRRGKIRQVKFPYDLGVKRNLYAVFGESVLYWPFPIKQRAGGLSFEVAAGEDPSAQDVWPPQDPYQLPTWTGPAHDFSKDTSPWTYGNGLNPMLRPSNSRHNVPPYHPDYATPEEEDEPRVRRGSEGWEVRDVSREDMLREYVASRGGEAEIGRYRYYIPEEALDDE